MSHMCNSPQPCLWLRLEWRLLERLESWAFSHRRRGWLLKQIVAWLDRTYSRQKHTPNSCRHLKR